MAKNQQKIEAEAMIALLQMQLAQGHNSWLHVVSNSMSPLLRAGDEIGLAYVDCDQLELGDIVTVNIQSILFTHRYYGRFSSAPVCHLTRGDRPPCFDPCWSENALVGRVVARRRKGRTVDLSSGIGRYLNRWLAFISGVEMRWLRPTHFTDFEQMNEGCRQNGRKRLYRFFHGSMIAVNTVLTTLVDHL